MPRVTDILSLVPATPADTALIQSAHDFAQKTCEGCKGASEESCFSHSAAVAKILAGYGMDACTIAAGLLHSAVEDARASRADVERLFGKDVLLIVDGVTKLAAHKYHGTERHAESLRRLLVATAGDIRALIVRLADRSYRMQTLAQVEPEERRRIALETLEIYAPIADRLGMGKMKRDLEDLAFPFIDPDAHAHTLEMRKLKTKETEDGLAKVQRTIQRALAKRGFTDFQTNIRIKGLWSLHQKLLRKDNDINRVHDIAALRIIVTRAEDCYVVLGAVHELYKPLPGEFKDYIAETKPNGYQSLHTTVVTPDAGIVEVQIRTKQMHLHARFGVASHMSYKQLGNDASKGAFAALSFSWMRQLVPSLLNLTKKGDKSAPASPAWLTELASAHAEVAGSKEFVEGLKEDFLSHRIFIFTPLGDVVDLPSGATPIDFAYAIHSDIGNHSFGAKVNGKFAAFDTPLENGDVVEIVQRESARPSAKWLEYAKTSLARKQIRVALGTPAPGEAAPRPARSSRHGKSTR